MKNKKKINSALRLKWAVICRGVSVDQKSGLISIFNIIEEICLRSKNDLPSKLTIPVDMNLVVNFELNDITPLSIFNPFMKVVILNPKEEKLGEREIRINFDNNKDKHLRVIIGFDNFNIVEYGRYEFVIYVKDEDGLDYEKIGSTSIDIKKDNQ